MSQPETHGDHDSDGEECIVPVGVLDGIDDLEEGRTLSDEAFDDALKF